MRDQYRSSKKQIRWDAKGTTAWRLNKTVEFTDFHREELSKICDDREFIGAINNVANQYLSRQPPKRPEAKKGGSVAEFKKIQKDYKKSLSVPPTVSDMDATLQDLKKTKNKVAKLGALSTIHPLLEVMKRAYRVEHNQQFPADDIARLYFLAKYEKMLKTTPKDHPARQAMQCTWDEEHQVDFDKLNHDRILELIEVCLRHLKTVYPNPLTNKTSAELKRFVIWRLCVVLQRFDIKPTQTKGGAWHKCLLVVLDATEQITLDKQIALDGQQNIDVYFPHKLMGGVIEKLKENGQI
jgi:hypothetical protein